jgi:hypothetical protein
MFDKRETTDHLRELEQAMSDWRFWSLLQVNFLAIGSNLTWSEEIYPNRSRYSNHNVFVEEQNKVLGLAWSSFPGSRFASTSGWAKS